ncbi:uncharacterized protein LOC116841502 isoform X2 [Odontomachus brunneus]|uniref:uncharacterized protein LOC116841502 isoform X2 n=1 Tax=Odontomachus brunneus TaxID=486640 RepID=UPI0013F181B8|nr:uncharacterized protein LOC116841502 isoform X2 [Odontomachus brunneus]
MALYILKDFFSRPRLRQQTHKIDNGIDRLSEIWKTPHLMIGGYGERTAEIDTHMKELSESIYGINDKMRKSRMEIELLLKETDQFLDETQTLYEDLKIKCHNIGIVLAEYGYHYEEHKDSILVNDNRNDDKDYTDESILNSKELEVEFTPNLTWKCKAKFKEPDMFTSDQKKPVVKSIATPVIKRLASVSLSENNKRENSLINMAVAQKPSKVTKN